MLKLLTEVPIEYSWPVLIVAVDWADVVSALVVTSDDTEKVTAKAIRTQTNAASS